MATNGRAFGVESGRNGARVVVLRKTLTPGCKSDREVDRHVQALKDELDVVAAEMKVVIRGRASRPPDMGG